MNELERERLRGLVHLLGAGIEHGSAAVEKIHRGTAERPFAIVAAIPPLEEPTRLIQRVHDLSLSAIYGCVRAVGRVLGAIAGAQRS